MMFAIADQVASGFSSAIIEHTTDKIINFLESNYDLSHATEELLNKLRSRLTMVKAIAEAADNQLIVSPSLAKWLRNLHDASYEVEDVLDGIDSHEVLTGKRKLSELISSSVRIIKSLIVPNETIKMLECVVQKLDHLCATSGTFVELVKQSNSIAMKEGIAGETTSRLPVDVKVFGRDEVSELILKVILGSSGTEAESSSGREKLVARCRIGGIDVLPIVGMSGVGKTTLAQVIYNHPNVKEHFCKRAWVYVSKHLSIKRTLQEMLCSFKGNDSYFDYSDSLETTINNIQNVIPRDGRFLLVLDSVWDDMCDHWNILLTAIACEVPGSVVLVTTQSKSVADRVSTMCQVPLAPLPWESFWPLFQYYAFGITSVVAMSSSHTLLLIGKEIAQKLGGMPLAAKVIGSLLRSRLSADQWRCILESDWWDLTEVLHGILPYMGVSYQNLQHRQRRSFAFCSIFPHNYLFDKKRLVNMWISHDFIEHNRFDGTRLEDVGSKLFEELVERSFFQPTFDNKMYTMHDLVRGLAIAVSSHEYFLHKGTSQIASPTVRHLAVQVGTQLHIPELNKYKNLRTILLFGQCDSDEICDVLDTMLANSRSIRVLDLSYFKVLGKILPNISSLRKLRFFDLSFTRMNNLRNFPCNLKVLYLRGYRHDSIPHSINKLVNLQHLYVDATALSRIPFIGQLSQLQELESFSAGKKPGFMINELKNMQELTGKLSINNIHIIKNVHEAEDANMIEKKHLESLELKGKIVLRDVLEGLQPHRNLQELKIEGYGARIFPDWMLQGHVFTNLQSLHVVNCRFLEVLPPFGKFHSLKNLTLDSLPSVKHADGASFGCLQNLEEFKVSSMRAWIVWSHVEEDHGPFLPYVKKFQLLNCPVLEEVPYLSFMSSLSELDISVCGNYAKALPQCAQLMACLKTLRIADCNQVLQLSGHHFKLLEYLTIENCVGLRLVDGICSFSNLRKVGISGCPDILMEVSDQSTRQDEQGSLHLIFLCTDVSLLHGNCFVPSLRNVMITYLEADHFTVEQAEWFGKLISVECLDFIYCFFLGGLPSTLGRLTSLRVLKIVNSQKVLPGQGTVPANLQELILEGYALDWEDKFKPGGSEWLNICHVPYIRLNGKTI
ncbi:putative disease resistance protein RGA1 isoform X1 [Lolium perenne]|uniref:putative disease resistance protein RGA1 isoform X1 n=1 Tax=Lolium perenne TaxID=4522 RepID=UPI0021F5C8E4|nr:disease resistance protein RGA2-like isoform X1 [Lolium perenne]